MSDCIAQTIKCLRVQFVKIKEIKVEFLEQLMSIGMTTLNTLLDYMYYIKPAQHEFLMNNEKYIPSGFTPMRYV